MSDDTVLVTGAGGFLGGRLCLRLARDGARVVGAGRRPPPDAATRDWRSCDVEDASAVARLLDETRPSGVFHLASHVGGSRELSAVLPIFHANVASTVYVLAAAERAGCRRVVLAGSLEELPLDRPARFPYAAAKRAAAEYGRFFRSAYGLSVVATRIGMVYGPGQRDASKLVPHVVLAHLAGGTPRVADQARRADWTYVDDVAEALCACLAARDPGDDAVDVGTGRSTSVGEIAAHVTAIMGGIPPEAAPASRRPNEADVVARADDTARRLGWRAQVDLDEGLRRTVSWYRRERAAGRL